MTRLSVIACLLPSALAAQQRGFTVGVTSFTGGNWQPSGVEVGTLRAVGAAPGQSVALMLRLGSFVQDQAVLIGGTTGFFVSVVGAYRRPLLTIAAMGSERDLSYARLAGVLELGVAKDFNSPLPQGNVRGTGAALVGFSFGGSGRIDENFAILGGPAWFVGDASNMHAQFTMRFQSPLGRGRRRGPPEGP